MVRPSRKSSLLPTLLALGLFVGALFGVHTFVDSSTGRQIADLLIVVIFFSALLLWGGRLSG